jgi:hypothetical protein
MLLTSFDHFNKLCRNGVCFRNFGARDHPKGAPVSFVNIRTNAESDPFPEASVSCETSVKQAFKLCSFSKVRRRTAETNKKLTFCSQVGFGQISSPRCKHVSVHQGKT